MEHSNSPRKAVHRPTTEWGALAKKEQANRFRSTDRNRAITEGLRQAEDEDHYWEILEAEWCMRGLPCRTCGPT